MSFKTTKTDIINKEPFMTENTITTVKPFLTVHNAKKAIDFYVSCFGAVETKRFEMPDQKISSVIEIDKAEFYVGDQETHHENLSPELTSSSPVRIILQTKNADQLFEKAIRFGATQICPMTTEEDWRIGKLQDPFGHIWEIGYTL
ncbi:VOC family protein [Rhodocytophaga aerolata]|uniref:VOC family protein n=1 Tax=Rhodocytophaga aerolata TaxID=455078 RepID=A0ABT8RKN1_9BACT|nr:VOC family protein [Rhodocytophaga aerolata]MDO1451973.1 VOC family protein [Rhodocytophaga aerolata]